MEKRKIELITISSFDGILSEDEKYSFLSTRKYAKKYTKIINFYSFRFIKNKKVIFFSARVHPGEVPSSYVMKGILKFLLNK